MNRILLVTLATALSLGLPAHDAEAKRLGGGGLKRSVPTQPAPQAPPAQPNVPQQAAPARPGMPQQAAAPAVAPKRSWLGPIAGLAAGFGLAALASHFGFGAELANVMMLVLLGLVAAVVVRWLFRRFAPNTPQMAGSGVGGSTGHAAMPQPPLQAPLRAPMATARPAAAFDTAGFEKIAKQVFLRLQAANDVGDQDDLRRFTTPQMYASVQHDLLERGGKAQQTEVLQLESRVVDVATDAGDEVVSVRFWGQVREHGETTAESFDEIWHLVRAPGSEAWLIAGIQQTV